MYSATQINFNFGFTAYENCSSEFHKPLHNLYVACGECFFKTPQAIAQVLIQFIWILFDRISLFISLSRH